MNILETGPMSFAEHLPPADPARHLAHPFDEAETNAMRWVDALDTAADSLTLAWLDLHPGNSVLEIGFGDARLVSTIVEAAPGLSYTGLELSSTMVDAASAAHAGLVDWGVASFHIGSAERMPFADAKFDRIVSVGLAHLWAEPAARLAECRRVIRPGGRVLLRCLHSDAAPSAQAETGFDHRQPVEWSTLFQRAGFSRVDTEMVEPSGGDEAPGSRVVVTIVARP